MIEILISGQNDVNCWGFKIVQIFLTSPGGGSKVSVKFSSLALNKQHRSSVTVVTIEPSSDWSKWFIGSWR